MRKHRLISTIVVLVLTVNLMLILNSQNALAATKTSLGSSAVKVSIDAYGTPYKEVSGYAAKRLILTHNGYTLKEGTDYTIDKNKITVSQQYSNGRYVPVMKYTIKAAGSKYSGTKTYSIMNPQKYSGAVNTNTGVTRKEITTATVQFTAYLSKTAKQRQKINWSSSSVRTLYSTPTITLYSDKGVQLVENKDYTIKLVSRTWYGRTYQQFYYVTYNIVGIGNYRGSRNITYYEK